MTSEVELKFKVRPEDLQKLRTLPLLRRRSAGRAVTRLLTSIYYDTESHRLAAANISLRVRRKGRQRVQTLKAPDRAVGSILVRHEYEAPVSTDRPVLSAIAEPALRRRLTKIGAGNLDAVFRTEIRRTSRPVTIGEGLRALVEIDEGEVRAGIRSVPVAEIEIEAEGGDPYLLYDLALEIHQKVPLRPSMETKSETGYRLLAGGLPQSTKMLKPVIDAGFTAEDALVHGAQGCLEHLQSLEAPVLGNDDPEGIHQMRVTLRRLRSLFRTFRPLLPQDQSQALEVGMKWLADALGPARDQDVFLDEIVSPVIGGLGKEADFGDFLAAVREERERCRKAAREAILSPRYGTLLLQLGRWLARRAWREQQLTPEAVRLFGPVTPFADTALAARFRKVRKLGGKVDRLDEAGRHELRIALKKLRYVLDFFQDLYPARQVASFGERLARLQDDLGYLNDVTIARKLVARMVDEAGSQQALFSLCGGTIIGWHEHAKHLGEGKLRRDMRTLLGRKTFWATTDGRAGAC